MSNKDPDITELLMELKKRFVNRFDLLHDKADDQVIDQSLREGAEFRGTILWILVFAILIASIGLNVNSTAVIIGAMLISPLMGPIIGVGYGLGIYDFSLIKKSLFNLTIAASIGLFASCLYFLVSPLSEAHSELLARTTPSIWDILIALFGGMAGAIGVTRKEKTNVIPGVAIATALMPPLCTAGYGLAIGNITYFLGAFYLFIINCVFIAISALLVIRLQKITPHNYIDLETGIRIKKYLTWIIVATIIPSLYLTYQLVHQEVFHIRAQKFIADEFGEIPVHIMDVQIKPSEKVLEATVIGDYLDEEEIKKIEYRMHKAGLINAELVLHQVDRRNIDESSIKAGIIQELLRERHEESQVDSLRSQYPDIVREIKIFYPQLKSATVAEVPDFSLDGKTKTSFGIILIVQSSRLLSKYDRAQMEDWLRVRFKSNSIRLVVEHESH